MDKENTENGSIEISLTDIVSIILGRIGIILLASFIAAVGAFIFVKAFQKPIYKASTTMYIYSSNINEQHTTQTTSDITIAKSNINLYGEIIKSNLVLNKVINNLNLEMTADELRKCVATGAQNDTEIIAVSVSTADAQLSADIANEIADVIPDIMVQKAKNVAGGVEVIDVAVADDIKNSAMSGGKAALLAAVAAFVLLSIVFIAIAMLDNRIRTQSDLEDKFEVPVLGVVPTINGQKGGN